MLFTSISTGYPKQMVRLLPGITWIMITFINKSWSMFCNFFKIWTCELFDNVHVCHHLHPGSAGCQEWGQDDRLAECAICGADNSTAPGNSVRNLPRPQCQPNQTYCTSGECLLSLCAGLWARAQACHQNRKKKKKNLLKLRFWSKAQSSIVNKAVHVKQKSAAAMTGTFYTIHPTYSILHWIALHFVWRSCTENWYSVQR